MNRWLYGLLLGIPVLALAAGPGQKGEPADDIDQVLVSFDQAIRIGDTLFDNGLLVRAEDGTVTLAGPPFGLAVRADLDAYDVRGLMSFDRAVPFPELVTAEPGDLVEVASAGLRIILDRSDLGLPDGVNLDAASFAPDGIAVSFDQAVRIDGLTVQDEDLVLFDPAAAPSLLFDGDAAGVDPGLDLDAAHVLDTGQLLLSFDQAGAVPGAAAKGERAHFADATVLLYTPATGEWSVFAEFEALSEVTGEYDLDALSARGDRIFGDSFEGGAR